MQTCSYTFVLYIHVIYDLNDHITNKIRIDDIILIIFSWNIKNLKWVFNKIVFPRIAQMVFVVSHPSKLSI